VFSGLRKTPWETNALVSPISVYGQSKLAGEIAVFNEHPDNSLVLRTAWLYSKYGKNFYKTILGLANRSIDPINVVNDQIGQPTNALELARFVVSTLYSDIPAGTYHASNTGSATWYDFALYIFQLAGADTSRIQPISTITYNYKAPRPEYSVLDNSMWRKLGVEPLGPWRESVAKAFPAIQESLS
jgi:dTDP-4-dehydrorhamnose reductase